MKKRSGLRRVGGLAGSWLPAGRAKVGRLEVLVTALSELLSIVWRIKDQKLSSYN